MSWFDDKDIYKLKFHLKKKKISNWFFFGEEHLGLIYIITSNPKS